MKKLAFFFSVALLAGSFASCSKCVECKYTDNEGEPQTAESCGKANNDDLEADLKVQWSAYGDVTCTNK